MELEEESPVSNPIVDQLYVQFGGTATELKSSEDPNVVSAASTVIVNHTFVDWRFTYIPVPVKKW